MDVVILACRTQTVEALGSIVLGGLYRCGGVPAYARDALFTTTEGGLWSEPLEFAWDEAEAGDVCRFFGGGEESLEADTDAEEGLVGGNVGTDGGKIAGGGERAEAVTEVAYAGKDEFLSERHRW